jgi:hypothetical protein
VYTSPCVTPAPREVLRRAHAQSSSRPETSARPSPPPPPAFLVATGQEFDVLIVKP